MQPHHTTRSGLSTMSKGKGSEKLYSSRIDLSEKVRSEMTQLLNESLASTLDLWTQVKQAHWNVKGKEFYQYHLLFDQIAGEVYEYIDMIAERVTALGGVANGTTRMAAEHSALKEYPSDLVQGEEHVAALADRLAAYGKHVRSGIEKAGSADADTADLYTEISRTIDQRLWFLESILVGGKFEAKSGELAGSRH